MYKNNTIPGDCVYHLDAVHQRRQRVDDGGCGPAVQGFDEALEGVEEFDVVLGLVCGLGNIYVNLQQCVITRSPRVIQMRRHEA